MYNATASKELMSKELASNKEGIMKRFYDGGRKRELESLDKLYARNEFTFAAIYGRRRVGKTSLIGEFINRGSKKAIRFTATENTDIINRENFSQSVFAVYPELSSIGCFPTWEYNGKPNNSILVHICRK